MYNECKDGHIGEDGWGGGEKGSVDLGTFNSSLDMCLCLALVKSTVNMSFVLLTCILRCFGTDGDTGSKTGSKYMIY
jgi:hypothetical protein